jgi:hypothetical protein
MKRPKLFLGITATLLAVAGLAAAKQQREVLTTYIYSCIESVCH